MIPEIGSDVAMTASVNGLGKYWDLFAERNVTAR
jgi:hypothetical protein